MGLFDRLRGRATALDPRRRALFLYALGRLDEEALVGAWRAAMLGDDPGLPELDAPLVEACAEDAWLARVRLPDPVRHAAGGLRDARLDGLMARLPQLVVAEAPESGGARFELRGELGRGGRGLVLRAWDGELEREVALKRLHDASDAASRAFRREARLTARLEHPHIVPVYDLWEDAEGRPVAVLRSVRGRSLAAALLAHAAPEGDEDALALERARLLQVLLGAARALAFAHQQGVVHGDVKPQNIMVGEQGEAVVVDWGAAWDGSREAWRRAVGTAGYAAPELYESGRRGDARSDVFAFGATLFHVLTGRLPCAPVRGTSALRERPEFLGREALDAALSQSPPALAALTRACLAADPASRPADAGVVLEALEAALAGIAERRQRREQASVLAAAGRESLEALEAAEDELLALAEARRELADHPDIPRERVLRRRARELRRRRDDLWDELQVTLSRATGLAAELPQVRALAARLYGGALARAEARGDEASARSALAFLKRYDEGQLAELIAGRGALHVSVPGDWRLRLWRLEEVDERFVRGPLVGEGRSVLELPDLDMGGYTLELEGAAGRHELPVFIPRCERVRLDLDPPPALPEGLLWVPAGPFICGEDDSQVTRKGRRIVELGEFGIARQPVTCEEYLAFLNALDEDEARRRAPRRSARGEPYWVFEGGEWRLPVEPGRELEGCPHPWQARWPVVAVSWEDAQRYAAWYASSRGVPARLPSEEEWEKAARGVDGRRYPWGPEVAPEICNGVGSFEDGHRLVSIDAFPDDLSPYGVRGLGGNSRDWCAEALPLRTDLRTLRGGMWTASGLLQRPANRVATPAERVGVNVGLRLACDIPRRARG